MDTLNIVQVLGPSVTWICCPHKTEYPCFM